MRYLTPAIRLLMGLAFVVFGMNAFLTFMPEPETLPEGAAAFTDALVNSGYMMPLIGATQLVAGLLLLIHRFVPLALALLAPFLVNSVAFHAALERTGLPIAVIFLAFELYLAWAYRDAFVPMLRPGARPSGRGIS